jgi:hypothetical protein
VRVRGAWDGAPPIYIGPFDSYDNALEAVRRSGGSLSTAVSDPKRDVLIDILNEADARKHRRRDRHTLPPKKDEPGDKGFDVPSNLEEYNGVYYREFGYH